MRVSIPNFIVDAIAQIRPELYQKWANVVSVVSQDENTIVLEVPEQYAQEFFRDLRTVLKDYGELSGFVLFIIPYKDLALIQNTTKVDSRVANIYNKWAQRVIVGADVQNSALFILIPYDRFDEFLKDYDTVLRISSKYRSKEREIRGFPRRSEKSGGFLGNPYILLGLGMIGLSVLIILKKKNKQ